MAKERKDAAALGSPVSVIYVDEIGRIDGAERVLTYVLANLNKENFRPLVVCGSGGRLVEELQQAGVEVKVVPMPELSTLTLRICGLKIVNPISFLRNVLVMSIIIRRLWRFLSHVRCDIIHANSLVAQLSCSVVGMLLKTPVVWHEHNIQPRGFRRWIIRWLANLSPARIICNSHATANVYEGLWQRKISVIHNGLDFELFNRGSDQRGLRQELGIRSGQLVVAMTSVLRPWKGHAVFLAAAQRIARVVPEATFLIVGGEVFGRDRGFMDYLKGLADELRLNDRVIFTGFRNDVPRILGIVDVFVSASTLPEPFSMAVVEAMAAGIPVVAAKSGGVPEVVGEDGAGVLVPVGDADSLATAVIELLLDRRRAIEMAKRARARARELFSARYQARQIEKLYADVLSLVSNEG